MRSKSFIVISIALLSLIAIEKSDAQVSTTNFTTSSSGWYRLGGWTASGKRGAERVVVSLGGGNHTPQSVVIDAYKNWTTGLHLDAKGIRNDQIEAVRIVSDGGNYYIEAYFDRAIVNGGYIYLYHIEGYQDGFTINSGALPTGAGTVEIDTGDIQSENQFGNDIRTRKGLVVDGNVGIGTTSPGSKLDIKGTITINDGTGGVPFKIWAGGNGTTNHMRIGTDFGHFGDAAIEVYQDYSGGSSQNPGHVVVNGQMGIGTSDIPSGYKLAVSGTAIMEEVKVESTPWPDYVFSDTYQLNPLSEVSTYIRENHHLPGIPTAEEVAENGIKLGEMNAKLLEKVEELTLYLIEQNEKIEIVLKENAEIRKENEMQHIEIESLKAKIK